MQLVSADRALDVGHSAAVAGRGVAADGAVGQRRRGPKVVVDAAAGPAAELPLTVQLVSVVDASVSTRRRLADRRSCR